jgi:membrane-bound lytic murein transglycosylase D
VTESELASANQLHADQSIQGIEALAVPVAPVAASSTRQLLYTVRKGDTLVTIADRFGVSLTQLRRWNKVSGIRVEPGRRLHVAEPSRSSPSSSSRHRATTSASAKPASPVASAKSSATNSSAKTAPSKGTKRAGKTHHASSASKQSSPSAKKTQASP